MRTALGRMHTPGLKDLAAATGLHVMTVSRALRSAGRMRPATRQRVIEAARRLDYRPDAAAAAMRTGRTGCIVLVGSLSPDAPHLSPHALRGAVAAVAARGGYLAHACLPADADVADAAALPRALGRRLAEGLLLDGAHDLPAHFESFLRRHGLPAVWLDRKRRANAVHPDDAGAGRRVTEQLLALGHRRIAFVRLVRAADAHRRREREHAADRQAGYEAAMRAAGLRPDVQVYDRHGDDRSAPVEARAQSVAAAYADPERRPTAAVVCRDGSVFLLLLQHLGLRAPRDISLVSFTTCPASAAEQTVSWVPLPLEEMGRRAVEMLYRLVDGGRRETAAIAVPYGAIASPHTIGPPPPSARQG